MGAQGICKSNYSGFVRISTNRAMVGVRSLILMSIVVHEVQGKYEEVQYSAKSVCCRGKGGPKDARDAIVLGPGCKKGRDAASLPPCSEVVEETVETRAMT